MALDIRPADPLNTFAYKMPNELRQVGLQELPVTPGSLEGDDWIDEGYLTGIPADVEYDGFRAGRYQLHEINRTGLPGYSFPKEDAYAY